MLETEIAVSPQLRKVFNFTPPVLTGSRKLIGLAGPARSGKDTVGGMLVKAYDAKLVAFADPIRVGLGAMFGFGNDHFHGYLKEVPVEPYGKSYRHMAQTLGTEWGRDLIHPDLWVLLAYEKVKKIHDEGFDAVITDVRFDNEADFIRSKGGVIWHIHRPSAAKVNEHKSEAGVSWKINDLTILNREGKLAELFEDVCDAFETY